MSKLSQWPPWDVSSLKVKLTDLADLVAEASIEPEVRPWLCRMLVVRSSGLIEQTVKEVCRGHISNRSGGIIRSFALSWLEKSRNPTPENLLEIVGRFDKRYQDELSGLFGKDDARLYRELSYLVDRRNRIAHGLNEGVTKEKAIILKDIAIELCDWFILRFNPD